MIKTGIGRTPNTSMSARWKPLRQVGDPFAAGDADQAALEDRQHPERDDDRGNAQIGDDGALRRHHRDADDERHEPGRRSIGAPATASEPLTVASTPISEPTEMSMLPEMITIDMPIAATAI